MDLFKTIVQVSIMAFATVVWLASAIIALKFCYMFVIGTFP